MTTTTDAPAVLAAEAEKRSAYTAGLRALAEALDADADLPLPFDGTTSELAVFTHRKAELVAYVRLLAGKVNKKVTDDENYGFQIVGSLCGVRMLVYAPRTEVCERVVTGTREVTEEVPDPKALAAVPTVTVTKTVEDVRWECKPLLADEPVST